MATQHSQEERYVITTFKMHGFTMKSEASKYLRALLDPFSPSERDQWLEKIIDRVPKLKLSSPILSKSDMENIAQMLKKENEVRSEQIFYVMDAFKIPRIKYVLDRKKFASADEMCLPKPTIFGTPDDKAAMFIDRYMLLHQRTSRNDLFAPPIVGGSTTQRFKLQTIEYLLGTASKIDNVIVLGMITQIKEGSYHLEDTTGHVKLDVSETRFHHGVFVENSFVLAEGWYEDGIFHVLTIGLPPIESHEKTRKIFGNLDFLKGLSDATPRCDASLRAIEAKDQSSLFVFLSDVWLDSPVTFQKLEQLFEGFAECPPTSFVLCGNFLRPSNFGGGTSDGSSGGTAFGSRQAADKLRSLLEKLAESIEKHPLLLRRSRFVFVPGVNDPGIGGAFPRRPLPEYVTKTFSERVPNATFATNPCRIQFYTQEIVVFREDVLSKMGRNSFYFPTTGSEEELYGHFVRTLLAQAHLCPLPMQTCPVYWGYDQALRLYPLPDLVIVADRFKPFTCTHVGCTVTNPGCFSRNGFSFKAYYPADGKVEDSRVPDIE